MSRPLFYFRDPLKPRNRLSLGMLHRTTKYRLQQRIVRVIVCHWERGAMAREFPLVLNDDRREEVRARDLSLINVPARPLDGSRFDSWMTLFSRLTGYVSLAAAIGTLAVVLLR